MATGRCTFHNSTVAMTERVLIAIEITYRR